MALWFRGMAPILFLFAAGPAVSGADATGPSRTGSFAVLETDTIKVAVVPDHAAVQPGDTVVVDLVVTAQGPAFNAFDARVTFDPRKLEFLGESDLRDQVGSLLKAACPQTFHLFEVAPDSAFLTINFSFLCPGTSVTGPGTIYRLRFRCGPDDADTIISLAQDPPQATRFFLDGSVAGPVQVQPVSIRIGEGASSSPGPPSVPLRMGAAPNPFNPRTRITFALEEGRPFQLGIYSLDGGLIRSMTGTGIPGGTVTVLWDGRDEAGRPVPSGGYLVNLEAREVKGRTKITLIR